MIGSTPSSKELVIVCELLLKESILCVLCYMTGRRVLVTISSAVFVPRDYLLLSGWFLLVLWVPCSRFAGLAIGWVPRVEPTTAVCVLF